MKEIRLHFYGLGYYDVNQAEVWIYDLNNNLILKEKTFNGCLKVCLKRKCFYKIVAKSCFETIKKTVYINQSNINIIFSDSLISNISNQKPITFWLTDNKYPNLPIEKGTIIFG